MMNIVVRMLPSIKGAQGAGCDLLAFDQREITIFPV